MARPTTLRFGAGVLYIGDGASPEVFTKVCGFDSADMTIDKSTNSTAVPDCDDPDEAIWDEKDVTTMGWSMSFSGVATVEGWPLLESATFSSASRNIRWDVAGLGTGAGTPNKRYSGKAHIKAALSGKRGERFTVKTDLDGDGELSRTNVAAA